MFSFLVLSSCIITVVFSSSFSSITCLIYSLLFSHVYLTLSKSTHTISYLSLLFTSILLSSSYGFSSSSNLEEQHWYEFGHTAFTFTPWMPIQWLANVFISEAFLILVAYSRLYLKEWGLVSTGTHSTWNELNLPFPIRSCVGTVSLPKSVAKKSRILASVKVNFWLSVLQKEQH